MTPPLVRSTNLPQAGQVASPGRIIFENTLAHPYLGKPRNTDKGYPATPRRVLCAVEDGRTGISQNGRKVESFCPLAPARETVFSATLAAPAKWTDPVVGDFPIPHELISLVPFPAFTAAVVFLPAISQQLGISHLCEWFPA